MTNATDFPLIMRRTEAAKLLRLTPSQVSRLASRGEIPVARVGGATRYLRDDLLRWLAAGGSSASASAAIRAA